MRHADAIIFAFFSPALRRRLPPLAYVRFSRRGFQPLATPSRRCLCMMLDFRCQPDFLQDYADDISIAAPFLRFSLMRPPLSSAARRDCFLLRAFYDFPRAF